MNRLTQSVPTLCFKNRATAHFYLSELLQLSLAFNSSSLQFTLIPSVYLAVAEVYKNEGNDVPSFLYTSATEYSK